MKIKKGEYYQWADDDGVYGPAEEDFTDCAAIVVDVKPRPRPMTGKELFQWFLTLEKHSEISCEILDGGVVYSAFTYKTGWTSNHATRTRALRELHRMYTSDE